MTAPGKEATSAASPVARSLRTLSPSKMRDLLPRTGLREYWYPAMPVRRVRARRPTHLKLLGQDIALFLGRDGHIAAISDRCTHRGGALSRGRCHFSGTVTCPYHGWTYNSSGEVVAVLGEGPGSRIPGMQQARARVYPTAVIKGVVWIWMGEGPAAPVEEDVPEQFFQPDTMVQYDEIIWKCNWAPAVENVLDAHVYYVHRHSMVVLALPEQGLMSMAKAGPTRPKPHVVNGRALAYHPGQLGFASGFASTSHPEDPAAVLPERPEFQDRYPSLGGAQWPKTRMPLLWARLITPAVRLRKRPPDPILVTGEWGYFHLPTTNQLDYHSHVYSRICVPVDESTTRMVYFHTTRPGGTPERLKDWSYFHAIHKWVMNRQFSGQDRNVVEPLYYDAPEKFSATDSFPLMTRRFILEYARDFQRAETADKDPHVGS